MTYLTLDYRHSLLKESPFPAYQAKIDRAHRQLHEKTGAGNEFLGWLDLPETYDRKEFSRIKKAAATIRDQSDIFLVIGIGGSYLGARAAIEMLTHSFGSMLNKDQKKAPHILFVGHHMSSTYIKELFDVLEGKEISVNVISKSGTTIEPAIAFRMIKKYMMKKYNQTELKQRIFVTTDKTQGALKTTANQEGYETFVIPDDIGGRYSVLTAVGLLPIAVSGLSVDGMLLGAERAMDELGSADVTENPSYQYAVLRHVLYEQEKKIELLIGYEPKLHYFQEWWKQLFGESEGKDGKGIFPAAATYTTDLHSLGQYIQDGERHLFQTILHIEKPVADLPIEWDPENIDKLNYLTDKTMHEVNEKAFEGAHIAHTDGGVPNLIISIPELNAFTFGYLVYFFEKACAISGYLLGVNPFDQPGVEGYKNNMFRLLGKPN